MKRLRRLYFSLFRRYHRKELRLVPYRTGDEMLRHGSEDKGEFFWRLAREEDHNHAVGWVYIECVKRITE